MTRVAKSPASSRRRVSAAPLAALAVAGWAAPAMALPVPAEHVALQARVDAVRAALAARQAPGAAMPADATAGWQLAAASNWTNWPKWSKWSNWANK